MKQNLTITDLKKAYNNQIIFENLSLSIPLNQITCILGPSGCGKTTLLNIISGIEKADSGMLEDFKNFTFSYVFQDSRLLPWKSIQDNLEFVLRNKYTPEERVGIIGKYLDIVGLGAFKHYYPERLSGGMRQRASIARAFAYPSEILIMDEPFKGLDIKTKKHIMEKFIELWYGDKRTIICVTHDIEECLMIADKILVLTKPPARVSYEDIIEIPHDKRALDNFSLLCVKERIKEVFFGE